MTPQDAVERLRTLDREIQLLSHALGVLEWDERTYLPGKGVDERSEQMGLVQGILHERTISPEIGELLGAAGASDEDPLGDPSLPPLDRGFVRAVHRRFARETRLPVELVTELVRVTAKATAVWEEARSSNDFAAFAPYLERIVKLTREKVDCIGYEDQPYDALLDEYEPWMKTAQVEAIFKPLAGKLSSIVDRIKGAPQVETDFLQKTYPLSGQEEFGRYLLGQLSFPTERGRLDVSAHPFTAMLGFDDVRITTHYKEDLLLSSVFATIHESGHALYDLGYPESLRDTLLANGTSHAIHESQSRTWENIIGRSRPFWECHLPALKRIFPKQLDNIGLDQFYRAANRVEPSLIRIEADEVTYGLHIVLRFNLELQLLAGNLPVEDAPAAWNEEMERLLGVRPDSDAQGILQDTHWSGGSFGYFPTYALGNLYGAQFTRRMRLDIPQLDREIASGNLCPVLDWLRSHIHVHGASLSANELCEKVTGETLNPDYFIEYLEAKFGEIYRF